MARMVDDPDVLTLAAELWNYDLDSPHVDGPPGKLNWAGSAHYGSFDGAFVTARLVEPHDGDCTDQPHTCTRCEAEEHVANARRLWGLGWRERGVGRNPDHGPYD